MATEITEDLSLLADFVVVYSSLLERDSPLSAR